MEKSLKKYLRLSSFTLIELIFVVMIISLIMPSMFALYNFIVKSNREINARQSTIQQGYEFFERLNVLMQDYTVDYEEYYNRQMVGCTEGGGNGSGFTRKIGNSGYCTNFTAYGNQNSLSSEGFPNVNSGYHKIYYCTSVPKTTKNVGNSGGYVAGKDYCGKIGTRQSYGQYEALFTDVHGDTESDANSAGHGNRIGDSDDENLGKAEINAIQDADDIQELYLISHDGKNRLFFRRKLVNVNTGDGSIQYKIQMLRLRGFDAGEKHKFDEHNPGLYDGKIDTWACDYGMGFEGHGQSIGAPYVEYRLPANVDDCWVDLTHGSTSVAAWDITISPTADSELTWAEDSRQINAFMKILTVNEIYTPYYVGKVSESIKDFKVPLETIINMKDFYRN